MNNNKLNIILILILIFSQNSFSTDIFINQIGYETNGYKEAIIRNNTPINESEFNILDNDNNIVFTGKITDNGTVDNWNDGEYYRADFTNFNQKGSFKIKIGNTESYRFSIDDNILFKQTAPLMIDFFYKMRNTMTEDKSIGFVGSRTDKHDVYGGWSDASGDKGKYISHLSWANYMNPQQIPMVVWSLASGYDLNKEYYDLNSINVEEEATWGADYLLRILDKEGYFYINVFDGWGWDPPREICAWVTDNGTKTADYQSGFREGGGMSIAALAKCAYLNYSGDSSSTQYLNGAIRAYKNIKEKNLQYIDNGEENIIDDYCALMATTELYKATKDEQYLNDAKIRVQNILDKQDPQGFFWSDNEKTRPFYHGVDEGLVAISLMNYISINNNDKEKIMTAINKSNDWYKSISFKTSNPFRYAKEYYKEESNPAKIAFFMPHNNETGYWWQGENARIASMSSQFLLSMIQNNEQIGDSNIIAEMAISQLNWICGENPKDLCMIYGIGQNNYPDYTTKKNVDGGICNGITSKENEETGYEFQPYTDSDWHNWRWIEQWLPHNAWFFYAINLYEYITNKKENIKTRITKENNNTIIAYPNPFNPSVNIISPTRNSILKIYNVNGQLIKTLQGEKKYYFSANGLSSGVYFVRTTLNNKSISKKLLYIK